MTTAESTPSRDFVRTIIDDDVKSNKHGGGIVTRFPPEPNGYLHLGHAMAICLDFGVAAEYAGRCHLRFDDTNPEGESVEYENAIQRDVRWLGFEWSDHLYYASDYFEQLYDFRTSISLAGCERGSSPTGRTCCGPGSTWRRRT